MNTATNSHRLLTSDDYSQRVVKHYLSNTPKPRLAHYPRIKRHADDCCLSDELLFDLNAMLLRLLHLQNECDANRSDTCDDLAFARDEAEAAIARLIMPHLSQYPPANSPLIPDCTKDLDQFGNELKAYVLVVQLYRGVCPPKHREALLPLSSDARVVLRTMHANRTRLLESFQSLRRNQTGWLERSLRVIK